jgi:hypothetical protein
MTFAARWLRDGGCARRALGGRDHAPRRILIASIKRVTGQRSNAIVLDYIAAVTLDDEPPLLEIVSS